MHRAARTRARTVDGFFDDLAVGSYVVHRQHGVARFSGTTTRAINGTVRDYLILEFRDGRSYWPTEQIDALTPYTGGDSPALSRMGGAEWQRTRAKARAAAFLVAQELVDLYRHRAVAAGTRLRARHRVAARDGGPLPLHAHRGPGPGHRGRQGRHGARRARWTAWCAPTSDSARPRSRCARSSRRSRTASRRRCSCPRRCSRASTSRRFARALRRLSRARGAAQPLRRRRRGARRRVARAVATGSVDVVIGTHRLLGRAASASRTSGCSSSTRSSASGSRHKEAIKARVGRGRRAHPEREPDPAHPRDGLRRHPRPLDGHDAAGRPAPDPHPRGRVQRGRGRRGDAPRAAARGPGLLRAQPRRATSTRWRAASASSCPTRASPSPTARWTRARSSASWSTSGSAATTCSSARRSSSRGSTCRSVNTLIVDHAERLGLGQLHQLRGRVGRGGQRAYAYLFHPADQVLSETAYERLRTIGDNTALGSGFKIAMRDLEIRGAGNLLGHDQSGPGGRGRLRPLRPTRRRGGGRRQGDRRRPTVAQVTLDVPGEAHLPKDYVEADDARLEAYRRLAARHDPGRARGPARRVARPLRPAARRRPRGCSSSPRCASTASSSACASVVVMPARAGVRSRPMVRVVAAATERSPSRCALRRRHGSRAYDEGTARAARRAGPRRRVAARAARPAAPSARRDRGGRWRLGRHGGVRRLIALLVVAVGRRRRLRLSRGPRRGCASTPRRSARRPCAPSWPRSRRARALQCYLTALGPARPSPPGSGGDSMTASGAAAWTNLRVEGLAIEQYVDQRLPLPRRRAAELSAGDDVAGGRDDPGRRRGASTPAPGTPAAGARRDARRDARRPRSPRRPRRCTWCRKLNSTIPLTTRRRCEQYYSTHLSNYDTLCVSVAVVLPDQESRRSSRRPEGRRDAVAALVAQVLDRRASGAEGRRARLLRAGQQRLRQRCARTSRTRSAGRVPDVADRDQLQRDRRPPLRGRDQAHGDALRSGAVARC